ncbi:MAG: hypothetical protein KAT75_04290 [Dehalococcoidia bacterium]|nr:hypothetical protein [Dehalococcoidia bacterium]
MEGEELVNYDPVEFVSGAILSGPGNAIWDDIFDWIASAVTSITSAVADYINSAVTRIKDAVATAVGYLLSPIRTALEWVESRLGAVWDWVVDIYQAVRDWISDAYNTVSSAVSSAIATVASWISSGVTQVRTWVSTEVGQVLPWITTTISNLSSTISAWFGETWGRITAAGADIMRNIASWIVDIRTDLSTFVSTITGQVSTSFDWLSTWMTENIVKPMDLWWDRFLGRIFDFGAWVGKLFDAIWGWFSEDIPGSSPRWEGIADSIGNWFYYWFGWYAEQWVADPAKQAFRVLETGLGWLGDIFNTITTTFMEALEGLIAGMGPTNPDIATDNYKSLASVGMTALAGLAGMTLASSWMKPLGGAGMGQIAAMIYDMTNYKVITGAAVTALTVAAIRTPLTYHFNDLFRPYLLDRRDFQELLSRRAFREPDALQNPELSESVRVLTAGDGKAYESKLIAYYGYPDIYHGLFRELANSRLGYFPLAGIARTGFFDRTWFTEALNRSGYSQTSVEALIVMYEKMVDEGVQGSMSGAAVKRFKEGLTTEDQFRGEMTLLGYSEQQFPKYLSAAKMDYAYDYTMDLVSAYRDAVRKGHIDLDGYRGSLLNLGMVPERVEGYLLRERARLKPTEALIPLAPPTVVYETDAGKVVVDTTRRRRRKLLITRDQEIATFIELGMEPGYATALADNDDVRLAEKGGEE